jgi:uncharacterized protein YndB with AHSA1/START domain
MIKRFLFAFAIVVSGAIAIVLVLASGKPDSFQVVRSISIKAPPEKIYPLIGDLKGWAAWSPYEDKDPNMKRSFGPVTAGKGAHYAWEGDKNVGKGSMEIVEAVPPSKVTIKLDFDEPFPSHNMVDFTLAPQGDATTVSWAMQGLVPFVAKIFHVLFDMDKMVGQDFEAGLRNLKGLAER